MTLQKYPYAQKMPYWKTSRSGWGSWKLKIAKEISVADGRILATATVYDEARGCEWVHLKFSLAGTEYQIDWPVLPIGGTGTATERAALEEAARVQAITFIYHDVKAKMLNARVLGFERSFLPYLLRDGRPVGDAILAAIEGALPLLEGEIE